LVGRVAFRAGSKGLGWLWAWALGFRLWALGFGRLAGVVLCILDRRGSKVLTYGLTSCADTVSLGLY
jgi:hypothetical protein